MPAAPRTVDLPTPQLEFVDESKMPRTKRAEHYEEKVNTVLGYALKATAERESTVADAAALIQYGPDICQTMGDLADKNENVRRAIDFITKGTENVYAAAMFAVIPLVAQVMRNHENTEIASEKPLTIKIPFLRREWKIPVRFKIRLRNPFMRAATVAPEHLTQDVFGNTEILAAMHKQGIAVAWEGVNKSNGTRATAGRGK